MDVSVIVPTRNRARTMQATLESLAAQQTGGRFQYEVILADNGSTDETRRVIQQLAAAYPVPLIYTAEPRPGKPFAVNAGLRKAQGALLVFTDDDALADPGWLAALWRCFEETDADAVGGRVLPQWVGLEPGWVTDQIQQHLGTIGCIDLGGERLQMSPNVAKKFWWVGSNIAVRRAAVERYGMYDERMIRGQDVELFARYRRAGARIVYEPSAVVRHLVGKDRLTPDAFRAWYTRMGYYRAYATPWRPHHLLTIMPLSWFKEAGRLALHWLWTDRTPEIFWQRLGYECRLRACWSQFVHRLQLWPQGWAAVFGKPNPQPASGQVRHGS